MKRVILSLLLACGSFINAAAPKIEWQPWSDDVFQKAKAEKRLVILDLGAVWCHWCHVMDETTYQDADVIRLMRGKYIAVRVDQDSRPDLSNRYEDFGWPATIVFAADGSELVKRRGYLAPKEMSALLQAVIDDPTPGPSVLAEKKLVVGKSSVLPDKQRETVRGLLLDAYDDKRAGWGDSQKYLNWDALEYCLTHAEGGDKRTEKMARDTLAAAKKLLDPTWGGIYQYSTDGDWDHQHFEKIMPFQTESMRIFAQAYALWHEPAHLRAAQSIHAYLKNFLMSPDGVFYVSQDADVVQGEHSAEYFALDDAARRKQGVPRIDKHLYARENGLAIMGLISLYNVTSDEACLNEARTAAEWVLAHRALPGGGFKHDEKDAAGPYLADTLCMARAFLHLHEATSERVWLQRAAAALDFMEKQFHGAAGFATAAAPAASLRPKPQFDENVRLARLANLMHHYTGDAGYQKIAEHAMRYLATPSVMDEHGYGAIAVLLADEELRSELQHITVIGAKNDAKAAALFAVARGSARVFKRVEWWDRREGPLTRMETPLPELPYVAAFSLRGWRVLGSDQGGCGADAAFAEAVRS